jgi:hypothetical protein
MTKGVGIAVAGTAFGVPMWGVALAVGGLLVLGAAGGIGILYLCGAGTKVIVAGTCVAIAS